jgi:hypothetical protein
MVVGHGGPLRSSRIGGNFTYSIDLLRKKQGVTGCANAASLPAVARHASTDGGERLQ